ncbi:MAG: ABC transporter ATP-binding protein [Tepidisphaeraceae bacterium]|jgi:putative ABC transport system ATP-binding protein
MGLLLRNLKKDYLGPDGSVVPIIDVPELFFSDGEQSALIGSSGSGKTTLLHLIAGILTPDSGGVLFGYDPSRPTAGGADGVVDLTLLSEAQRDEFRGRYIGYIFQTHHLLGGFTALENVLLGMSFTGRGHDRAWAEHLLTEVGLSDRLHYRPQKLSVGQQQRVAVARALANRPRLVLADEPTGALDAASAQQVLELIRKLCGEINSSLLLVTHDLDIAGQLPKVLKLSEFNRAAAPAGGRAA